MGGQVLFLLVVVLALVAAYPSADWQSYVYAALLYGPILLLTILVHELGHCLMTRRVRAMLPLPSDLLSTSVSAPFLLAVPIGQNLAIIRYQLIFCNVSC